MDGAPHILNEVDALASMIENGKDRVLQTLGKEPEILVTSLLPLKYSMANQKSFPLCCQLNRIPRTN